MYHDKAAFYYDMWSDIGDGLTDLWRGTKDVLRGAVDAVTDLGEGLLVIAMWSSPVVRVGQLFGMLPEYAEEKVAEMDAGILQLLQDPINTIGAIGQNMADTVDEEGLAYGISYVATDAAVEILLEKGLGKVMEGGSKLDDVTGHMDDAAAGAGKYADDVADAVTDVEKHVDDVTVIEGAGGPKIPKINPEELKMSQTVQNHINDIIKRGPNKGQLSRPYVDSNGTTLLLDEIMKAGTPLPDTIIKTGLRLGCVRNVSWSYGDLGIGY